MLNFSNQYLNTKELAGILNLKINTLERWRTNRNGPFKWLKIGSRVLYDRADIIAYLESQKRDKVNPIIKEADNGIAI